MVFGIGYLQLETLKLQTTTHGEACPMIALAFPVRQFHLAGTTEIIASTYPDGFAQQEVCTYGEMLADTLVPSVQSVQGGMESQGGIDETLADAQL